MPSTEAAIAQEVLQGKAFAGHLQVARESDLEIGHSISGTVISHTSGRYPPGWVIVTSPLERGIVVDGELTAIVTRNSVYRITIGE